MVHKYELSEYAGCGLGLLTKVAEVLGVSVAIAAAAGRGLAVTRGVPNGASTAHA
jgi:hypothetical protein